MLSNHASLCVLFSWDFPCLLKIRWNDFFSTSVIYNIYITDSTDPKNPPILTYQQWGSVALISEEVFKISIHKMHLKLTLPHLSGAMEFKASAQSYISCPFDLCNRPISHIPKGTHSISHNAPFRTEICTFLFWMEQCGILNRCILGFVKLVHYPVVLFVSPLAVFRHWCILLLPVVLLSGASTRQEVHPWAGCRVVHSCKCWQPAVDSFTEEVNLRLAKRPLVFNGHLAYCRLISLVKEATAQQLARAQFCLRTIFSSTGISIIKITIILFL